jgi:branched-chain amino acid transport system permease protein
MTIFRDNTTKGLVAVAAGVALAAVLPRILPNPFYIHVATMACINLMFVLGLAIIARAGQLSLAHAGFGLVGGYVSSLLAMKAGWPPLLGLFCGALVSAVIAFVMGWIILRLRGIYFVLVTFAFAQIVVLIALDWQQLTGGANGLISIPPLTLFGKRIVSKPDFYPVALTCAAVTILLTWLLYRSPLGDRMAATAENQRLAESSGVDTHMTQVIAFTIGSAVAGFAGALSTHYIRFISPDSFTFWDSVNYLTMLVVGGRTGVLGPLVGVLVLTPLPELLRDTERMQQIIYGAALVLSLIFVPAGLSSLFRMRRFRRPRTPVLDEQTQVGATS